MLHRYELKFLVTAAERAAVIAASQANLVHDAFSAGGDYRVTSQYFDSPGLTFFWEKLDGVSERRKFRLRFYGDGPVAERPAFMEIKHRRERLIHKERVRTERGLELLDDATLLGSLRELVVEADRDASTVGVVERAAVEVLLQPANVITYRREAFQSLVDERLRVTFDQQVRVHRPGRELEASEGLPIIPETWSVMELKFNERIPRWIRDIVVDQGLRLQSFSKYAEGMLALRGEPSHGLAARD